MKSRKKLQDLLPADTEEFQRQALQAEQLGRWPEEWLNFAAEHKLFHLAISEMYGGRQLPLLELMTVFEEAAKLDGSFGWSLTLGAGAGPFTAYMNPGFVKNNFSNSEACIAGTGHPGGTFKRKGDDFLTTGTWKYITGAPHATLFTAVCREYNSDKTKIMIFLPDEVTILKSWNSYGLKATASHNVSVKEVNVPKERIFTLDFEQLYIDEPLFRFPFEPFARCTLASTFWGIGAHFLDEAAALIRSKENHSKVKEKCIEEVADSLHQARQRLRASAEKGWQQCLEGRPLDQAVKNEISAATLNLVKTTLDDSGRLYKRCGMGVLNENSTINRAWRDLHTASQHTFFREVDS